MVASTGAAPITADKLYIEIPLQLSKKDSKALNQLFSTFRAACQMASGPAREFHAFNRVVLHYLVYRKIRDSAETAKLSSQMACNAIQAVCHSYLSLAESERAKYLSDAKYKMSWDRIPVEKQTIKIADGKFYIKTPNKVQISAPIPDDLQEALATRTIFKGYLYREGDDWCLQAETRPLKASGQDKPRAPIPADILSVLADRAIAAGALYFEANHWSLRDEDPEALIPLFKGSSWAAADRSSDHPAVAA